jgi:hypothetical protein
MPNQAWQADVDTPHSDLLEFLKTLPSATE